MSPLWQATSPQTSGCRIACTSAPYPPLDFPAMARASGSGIVR
jgi:hypothetical protein